MADTSSYFLPNGDLEQSGTTRFPDTGELYYEDWDDPVGNPDDDTTYLRWGGGYCRSYVENHTTQVGTISKIVVHARALRQSIAGNYGYIQIKHSGVVYESTVLNLATSYGWFTYEWLVRPNDSQPWTWTDIDNLVIGFRSSSSAPQYVRCTSIYLEVVSDEPTEFNEYPSDSLDLDDEIIFEVQKVINDSLNVSDNINLYLITPKSFLMRIGDGLIVLHKPYYGGFAEGNTGFTYSNLRFKSDEYTSYINVIDENSFSIKGFEYDNALEKLEQLSDYADEGEEIEISLLDDTWDDTYIIRRISYSPIGKIDGDDVWEYDIEFLKASDSMPSAEE